MSVKARLTVLMFLTSGTVAYLVGVLEAWHFLDLSSLAFVFLTGLPAIFLVVTAKATHWSDACLTLGIPIGLLGGTIGVTGMGHNISEPDEIYGRSALIVLTVLYGGVVSAVGYFARPQKESSEHGSLGNVPFVLAVVAVIAMVGWTLYVVGGIRPYVSPGAIFVFCFVFAAQYLLTYQRQSQDLVEATLFASILCLVIALFQWYSAGDMDGDAIAFAVNGLNYGLLIYIFIYFLSLRSRTDRIKAGRANWHWIEVTAFLVFMLFAPETIRETLINQQDEEAALIDNAKLQEELSSLKKRLALLEGS